MKKMDLDFIIFDLIGTTIKDNKEGGSLILDSFQQAFAINGQDISYEALNQQRGKRKREAIQQILSDKHLDAKLVDKIYADFMNLLNQSITSFSEIKDATKVFQFVKNKGIKIGIGSGLPLQFMYQLIQHLKWDRALFDYIGSSDELAAGRPNPIMILEAMKQLQFTDPNRILKIGDTKVDVQEGKNAGVLTAMVLTGTQNQASLGNVQPDYIFENINDLTTHYLL